MRLMECKVTKYVHYSLITMNHPVPTTLIMSHPVSSWAETVPKILCAKSPTIRISFLQSTLFLLPLYHCLLKEMLDSGEKCEQWEGRRRSHGSQLYQSKWTRRFLLCLLRYLWFWEASNGQQEFNDGWINKKILSSNNNCSQHQHQ